jgi:8-oxo-dGTP pyrophosphatase MutT (NUDIX family)
VDAATVVLLRDCEGPVETFLVRRHHRSAFMGGAFVFPGGKLDRADRELPPARWLGPAPGDAARALGEGVSPDTAIGLFIAGLRETFEEAGVLLAEPAPDGESLTQARRRLLRGEAFAGVLASYDARLRLDRLVPFERWVTPEAEPRRYDTRFFLARAPETQVATADERETTTGAWMTPADAIDQSVRGHVSLAPPTLRTLEQLAEAQSVQAALDAASRRAPPTVRPLFRVIDERPTICLPGDDLHPERARVVPGPTRIVLAGGRWQSGET